MEPNYLVELDKAMAIDNPVPNVLPIILYENECLRSKAKKVKHLNNKIHKLIADMIVTGRMTNGYGLSSNQVGSEHSIFVCDTSLFKNLFVKIDNEGGYLSDTKYSHFINPEIIEYGEELETQFEGCLSIPNIKIPVERPRTIKVKYQTIKDFEKEHIMEIEDIPLLARIFQHEIDHLNGILIVDKIKKEILTDEELNEINRKLKRIKEGRVSTKYMSKN